jgi:hypothetical protein
MDNCKSYNELKSAKSCVICGRPFFQTRGHKIIAQKLRGISFSDRYIAGGSPDKQFYSQPLNDTKTEFMVFWGEVGFWSNDSMKRAIETYKKNTHPYFCSYCGKRTCSLCGKPLMLPVGSDYLTIDDRHCHSPILGVNVPCINPSCKNYFRNTL